MIRNRLTIEIETVSTEEEATVFEDAKIARGVALAMNDHPNMGGVWFKGAHLGKEAGFVAELIDSITKESRFCKLTYKSELVDT